MSSSREAPCIMESHTVLVFCSTLRPAVRSANKTKKNATRQSYAVCQTVKQSLVLPGIKSPISKSEGLQWQLCQLAAVSCNLLVLPCALIFLSPVCMPSFYADQQRCGRLYGPSAEGWGKGRTVSNNFATCASQLRYKETDKRNGDYATRFINISLARWLRTN